MSEIKTYRIPDEYFFRLHHVRPRFKNDVEEVLLYVATSISEMTVLPNNDFRNELNKVLFGFKKNATSKDNALDCVIVDVDERETAATKERSFSLSSFVDLFWLSTALVGPRWHCAVPQDRNTQQCLVTS